MCRLVDTRYCRRSSYRDPQCLFVFSFILSPLVTSRNPRPYLSLFVCISGPACLYCLLLLVQSSPSPHEIIARFSISSALACPTRDCSVLMTCPMFAKLSASLSLPWTFLEYTFFSVTRVSSC